MVEHETEFRCKAGISFVSTSGNGGMSFEILGAPSGLMGPKFQKALPIAWVLIYFI